MAPRVSRQYTKTPHRIQTDGGGAGAYGGRAASVCAGICGFVRVSGGWLSVRLRVPSIGRVFCPRFSSDHLSLCLLTAAYSWTRPGSTTADSSPRGAL